MEFSDRRERHDLCFVSGGQRKTEALTMPFSSTDSMASIHPQHGEHTPTAWRASTGSTANPSARSVDSSQAAKAGATTVGSQYIICDQIREVDRSREPNSCYQASREKIEAMHLGTKSYSKATSRAGDAEAEYTYPRQYQLCNHERSTRA